VTNGDDVEDGGAVKAVIINGGRRSTRSSASSRGSIDLKGKGKALPIEEEDEEEDVDAEYDEEEEEGMDIDAEGEEDDDVVMGEA
jgi:histone acetyltransferase SAS3